MSAIFRAVAALNVLCGLIFPIKGGSIEAVILRRITCYGVHAPERQVCCKMRGQQMTQLFLQRGSGSRKSDIGKNRK